MDRCVLYELLVPYDYMSHHHHHNLVRPYVVVFRAMSNYRAMCPWVSIFTLYCYILSSNQK